MKRKNLLKKILKNKKRLIVFGLVISALFLIWRFVFSGKQKPQTAVVERGVVRQELILSGKIDADEYVKLTFPTSGKISWVGVKEGDLVKKGQALIKLDTVVLNTAFQQAKASLRAAEAELEEVYDQVKDHAGDETFEQKNLRTAAEAAKDKAYEAYIAAEYNLRNATLVAPFSGIVTFLAHPYPGVNVLQTESQVEIINPETIYFDVSADETEVVNLSIGQKVIIVLDSLANQELEGEVSFIGYTPRQDEVGSVYKVKVKFIKGVDYKRLKIGMGGDARFILSEKRDVLYLPPKFVKSDSKGRYIKKGEKNNKVYVEVGVQGEDRVEIIGDVEEKDVVFD